MAASSDTTPWSGLKGKGGRRLLPRGSPRYAARVQFSLDATAHHFGANLDYAKQYLPVPTASSTYAELTCQQNAAYFLQLQFHNWTRVDDDWWSVTLDLRSPDGHPIGLRPALVYGKPYDVPTYTAFHTPEDGLISVGLRTRSAG